MKGDLFYKDRRANLARPGEWPWGSAPHALQSFRHL